MLRSKVILRPSAWGMALALLLFAALVMAQPPTIEINAETGLPTAADIDDELAERIAAQIASEQEATAQQDLEPQLELQRPNRKPTRESLGFYRVRVDVQTDGSLEVTETIDAYALGQQIKRGIFREFSLLNVERYQPSNPYTVLSVKRDGSPIQDWFEKRGSTFYQVYMGSPNRLLTKSRWYTYELKYRVPKAILQYEDHDLLYWNVIPFHWAFPIGSVEVEVRFPEGFVTRDVEIKSGRFGAKHNYVNAEWQQAADNVVRVTANDLLAKRGITLMVKTRPDLVEATESYPTADLANSLISGTSINDQGFISWLTTKPLSHVIGPIGMAGLAIGLMIFLWRRVGIDPPAKTIVPLYDAPRGLSAAGARYIYQFGYADPTHLMVTAVVSAATKGVINIDDKHASGTMLTRTGAPDSELSLGERVVLKELMGGSHEFLLQKTTTKTDDETVLKMQSTKLIKTQDALIAHLDKELGAQLFEWRTGYKIFFWALALVTALAVMILVQNDSFLKRNEQLMSAGFVSLSVFLPGLLMGMREKWMINKASFAGRPLALATDFFFCSFFAFVLQYYVVAVYAEESWPLWQTLVLLMFPGAIAYGLGFSAFLMAKIIDSPTVQGTRAIAEVKGLRMYIAAAEEKLDRHLTPTKTPEQFTRLYPYAFALKLEAEWIDQFSEELSRWMSDGTMGDQMNWYQHRSSSRWGSRSTWTTSFSDSVTSGVGYTPPSAGGGGGGFGGGGGGGGF